MAALGGSLGLFLGFSFFDCGAALIKVALGRRREAKTGSYAVDKKEEDREGENGRIMHV